VLEGRRTRLEPLSPKHLDGLAEVGLEPAIWRWMPLTMTSKADLGAFIDAALAAQAVGREQAFATVDRSSGRVVGSTRYLNIEPAHRRLEIGYTWLAPAWQKTATNSEAKLLMLAHAIEQLGANRVEFKTDARNDPSRKALLGIGAQFEGIFRRHMIVQQVVLRDSAYYSVIVDEWPAVRRHLEQRVERLSQPAR
jgi:RimJ/RimL family protein N-acetyltransferase